MSQRRKPCTDATESSKPTTFDVQLLSEVSLAIVGGGFTPEFVLREQFGPTRFTQAEAVLYRYLRVLVRERRPWGDSGVPTDGYRWADRRFSTSQRARFPAELHVILDLGGHGRPRYAAFCVIRLRCRWTNFVVAGQPDKDEAGELRMFHRDAEGHVLIPAYCLRAMAKKAMPALGLTQELAYRIQWATIRLESPPIKYKELPVVDEVRHEGRGLTRHEILVPPLDFVIEASVPTSALAIADFVRLIRHAGKFVRLSPGRSAGFGDFEVLEVEEA